MFSLIYMVMVIDPFHCHQLINLPDQLNNLISPLAFIVENMVSVRTATYNVFKTWMTITYKLMYCFIPKSITMSKEHNHVVVDLLKEFLQDLHRSLIIVSPSLIIVSSCPQLHYQQEDMRTRGCDFKRLQYFSLDI